MTQSVREFDRLVLELVEALDGVVGGVALGQRHLHLAVADHVHVGDRARGGLGGDGPARHLLAEQVGHRATQRIVDASCRSGRDRELGLRLGRARPGSCQAQRTRRAAGGDRNGVD